MMPRDPDHSFKNFFQNFSTQNLLPSPQNPMSSTLVLCVDLEVLRRVYTWYGCLCWRV
jgi:hypothetical protein